MNRLRNILCPVDFSDSSYRAIEQASFLAQMLQADLTLMHVVREQLPGKMGMVHGPDRASQELVERATEDARILLREAKKKYVPYAITCKSAVRYGATISEIAAEAAERDSGLLFIPCDLEGVSNPGQSLNLLQEAPCSVLFCRNLSERKGFRNMILAFPQERTMEGIAPYLYENFNLMMQRLHVLVPGGDDAEEPMLGWDKELRQAGLDEFSSQYVSHDMLAQEWINAGQEAEGQLLIVPMADTKDKTATQRLRQLLEKSAIPVFVWKAKVVDQTIGM